MIARLLIPLAALGALALRVSADEPSGELSFKVTDAQGKELPCRIHFSDVAGNPMFAPGAPAWRDHFVCAGEATLTLRPAAYRYAVERGPEWSRSQGTVEFKAGEKRTISVKLKRIADLAADGWYSGDLHIHRPLKDIELLMKAEDLHIGPVITWWNENNTWKGKDLPRSTLTQLDGNRFYDVMAGEDERGGGALLYFHLRRPLPITGSKREFPSPMKFVSEARKEKGVWIDIEKPFWWDVPIWLASGQVDSIGIAHNHMHRGGVMDSEAWGKPRDKANYSGPHGNSLWTQDIYYHALNCGLRVPPSAGSASGVLPNPVGYNRVYVHTGKDLTWGKWWEGLKAGRSFVTNGPLLRATANGEMPGHIFAAESGKEIEVDIAASIVSNDPIRAVEVVRDGDVIKTLRPKESSFKCEFSKITFRESGWFLVRAIADVPNTFRFASTAPFYVEIGGKKKVQPRSARFFLDWTKERSAEVARLLTDPDQRREVLRYHEEAERFWRRLAE
jgi:hypothetical protein